MTAEDDAGSLDLKFSGLVSMLREAGGGVLAFSGGVDSSFLLKAMKISGVKIVAVTAVSETMQAKEAERAAAFAAESEVEHLVIRTDELSDEAYVSNSPDRCFFCKNELFGRLRSIAAERGFEYVFDGSNADDLGDYRPGRRAAGLHGVRSPLAECHFSKDEIRQMSRRLGLAAWDRPSSPCLSSRFPYGQRITREGLQRVERAEEFLRGMGFRELRVRNHGDIARIEVAEAEMPLLLVSDNRRRIADALRSLGYTFVSVDLDGYRSGSLNRVLEGRESGT